MSLFLWVLGLLALGLAPLYYVWWRDHERARPYVEHWKLEAESWKRISSVGAMEERDRAAVLSLLMWEWRCGTPAFTEEMVREIGGLTPQQAVALMHWAHGQRLKPGRDACVCLVERGIETRYLRFRPVAEERRSCMCTTDPAEAHAP